MRKSGTVGKAIADLKPGMERMISALERRPQGFNKWAEESRLSKRYVVQYRQDLLRRKIVQYDPISRKYSLTQDGKGALWALSASDFLRLHPPSRFDLSLGIKGRWIEELGAHLMDVDYAHSVSLAHDRPIDALSELFENRMVHAPDALLREILALAIKKNILQRPRSAKLDVSSISKKEWRRIFRKLCPEGHELVYVEHIDLKDLQRCVTHPKFHESSGLSVKVGAKSQEG